MIKFLYSSNKNDYLNEFNYINVFKFGNNLRFLEDELHFLFFDFIFVNNFYSDFFIKGIIS